MRIDAIGIIIQNENIHGKRRHDETVYVMNADEQKQKDVQADTCAPYIEFAAKSIMQCEND
jgi:hypothetical protein